MRGPPSREGEHVSPVHLRPLQPAKGPYPVFSFLLGHELSLATILAAAMPESAIPPTYTTITASESQGSTMKRVSP